MLNVGDKAPFFSLYDSDFVLVQIDMRHFIGYTIRNIVIMTIFLMMS